MANNNDNFEPGDVQVLRPHPEDVWIFQLAEDISGKPLDRLNDQMIGLEDELGLKKVLLLSPKFTSLTVRREPLTVIEEVAAMREKQISKGYDAAHDDHHDDQSLALVAAHLAIPCTSGVLIPAPDWGLELEDSHGERENLIIAAALLIAEAERMDRAEVTEGGG